MARPKRSLSSLFDDEEPTVETPALEPVLEEPTVETPALEPVLTVVQVDPPKAESTLAVVPPPPVEPVEDAVERIDDLPAAETVDQIPIPSEPFEDASIQQVASDVEPDAQAIPSGADDLPLPEVEPLQTTPVAVRPSAAAKPRQSSAIRQIKPAPEPAPVESRLPLYLELTRKEARFRQDQLNALTVMTRQLNRRRTTTGERITDNTLIRVAVDMMLEVADSLAGSTEADLLASMVARLK